METFKREIFEGLGNLFYSLAKEQGVPPIAAGELKMLMRKDWLIGSNEAPGKVSEAAHLIGVTIDALQNDDVPALTAFRNFETFFTKHEEQLSHALKQKILETAETIVTLFAQYSPENGYLMKLRRLLEQSEKHSQIIE